MSEGKVGSGLPEISEPRGARLRRAREDAGLTVDDMAKRLRLSIRQIHALEADEEAALPPATFVRGFVRNYARVLNLDPADFLPPFVAPDTTSDISHQPSVTVPRPEREIRLESGRATANRRWLVAALVALVLGAFGSWIRMEHVGAARELIQQGATSSLAQLGSLFSRGAGKRSPDGAQGTPVDAGEATASRSLDQGAGPAASSPDAAPSGQPSKDGTADAASVSERAELKLETAVSSEAGRDGALAGAAGAQAARSAGGRKLELEFDADSWVEVRDETGRVLLSGVSKAGDHRDLEAHGPVRIVVGNAPGTRVSWNGHPVDLAEFTRVTVARLTLDPAADHP